jgi:hypothetical protein
MIQDLLNDIILKDGETIRLDCPSCGGYKTFTITKLSGSTVWNCYKASCNLKGGKGSAYSLQAYQGLRNTEPADPVFDLPHSFSLDIPDHMVKYLEKNNVLKAWRQGLVDLYHDVSKDRAVFLIKKDGKPVDAVGRALGYGMKWLRYGKSTEPFVVKTDLNHVILVEDAASACAVSEYGTGIALLGTSLTCRALEVVTKYKSVTVALDRDAFNKSLAFTRRLRQYMAANAKLLREDPKVYPKGVIE